MTDGDEWVKTPQLERMASEGMTFTDVQSNSSVCSPTRAAFLTGRYQQRVGIVDVVARHLDTPGLDPSQVTLPRLLMDFLPTALDIAGVAVPQERKLDGKSIKSLLLDWEEFPDRILFFGYEPKLGTALRDGDWKMIIKWEKKSLYNLADDLGEQTNLIEAHPERAAQMAAAIADWKNVVKPGS